MGRDRQGMWDTTDRAGRVGCDGRGATAGRMGHDGQGMWESGHDGEAILYASVAPGIQRLMSTMLNGPCMHHARTMGGIKAPQLM